MKVDSKIMNHAAPVKHVALVFRSMEDNSFQVAKDLSIWFKNKGIKIFSHPDQKIAHGIPKLTKKNISQLQMVVVLGGDGTYLQAVRMLKGMGVPILGINLGSLGFLTETPESDLYPTLQLALDKKLEMRPRAMLEAKIIRGKQNRGNFRALNDIIIERGQASQLLNLNIFSKDSLVSHLKADGLVISTPTGSTAYNLAAGGPILHPGVQAFVVTPICPHALTNRPIIFSENQVLRIHLTNVSAEAQLMIDGQRVITISKKDELIIQKAKFFHYVLRHPNHNYFDLLREKLRFGERA